jgi:hypothetical protein
MRRTVRTAVFTVLTGALLTGCTAGAEADGPKPEAAPGRASGSPSPAVTAEPSPGPSASEPSSAATVRPSVELEIGDSGRWDSAEPGGSAGKRTVRTTFEVTARSAEYVTAAEVGAPSPARHGQYLVLTLTLKNVGPKEAAFRGRGAMKWETEGTAARDATTRARSGGPDLNTTYQPGQSVTGSIVLDIGRPGGLVSYYDTPGAAAFTVYLPRS